jgi:DHA1 family inner membrane transport protein
MSQTEVSLPANVGLTILALAMGGFAIGTTEFASMSLVPYFAHDLGIDVPTAGHVISAYALGVVVGAPVLAVAGSRLPRRSLLIGLMAMFALGNALTALSPSYHWMLLFRFLSGLPHGAYFGIGALVAASLVPPQRRTQVVGRMFIGLTVATIVGVPLANGLGQILGWRSSFLLVAALGGLALTLVALFAPKDGAVSGANPLAEFSALRRPQVWLTLAIGAVGFGGLFAVYTYLANTMMAVTHVSGVMIPIVLSVLGIGFTIGNIVVPWFADRAILPTAGGLLLWSAVMLAAFSWAAPNVWLLTIDIFMIGIGGALGTVLQTRLMDVSGDAQALPAALNHSAFNTANALGPWLGGLAINAGFGWTSTGWVGALLAVVGLGIWLVSFLLERTTIARSDRNEAAHQVRLQA